MKEIVYKIREKKRIERMQTAKNATKRGGIKNQNTQKPKHAKTKTRKNQNTQKPKHAKTKTRKNQNTQKPKHAKIKNKNI